MKDKKYMKLRASRMSNMKTPKDSEGETNTLSFATYMKKKVSSRGTITITSDQEHATEEAEGGTPLQTNETK